MHLRLTATLLGHTMPELRLDERPRGCSCCPCAVSRAMSIAIASVCSTAVKLEMRSYFLSFLDRFRLCPSCCLML